MRTFSRLLTAFALLACAISPAAAQTGEALLRVEGAFKPIPHPEHVAPKNLVYKVAWDVTVGPKTPGEVTDGFRTPANFLMMADTSGIPRKNVHLAMIVHGTATRSLLQNDAYKAATGVDNPNIALLEALHGAGVEIIVCGQALVNRNVPRDKLLPFVKTSISATLARAVLNAQGYASMTP
ncbi:MAG: DsrE family protein [Gemmatimonadetes bacterium]|nr:DsrE family protein [Gemmatimonadota bacterium]